MQTLKRGILAASMAITAVLAAPAHAAGYPDRPIRLVVPNPPGGTTDLLARLISSELTDQLKQTVVVENRPGAGGAIAARYVLNAAPDGYTLMMVNINSHRINAAVINNLSYDPVKDFAPITIVGSTPNVLLVNPSLPVKNLSDLIALAKSRPGTLNFGSTSPGGSPHMSGELLKFDAKVDMVHVPYKGAAPMLTDLMAGQISVGFDNLPSALNLIQAGKVRALAVTTEQRWPSTPDIPTVAESGLPGYEVSAWFGLAAPAATPQPVIDKLYATVSAILKRPDVRKRLYDMGASPGGLSPAQFSQQIRDGIVKWKQVADATGVHLDN